MSLPEPDRIRLAGQLLSSVKPSNALSAEDPSVAAEIERRADEVDAGEVEPVDWATVRQEIQRRLSNRDTP